MSGQLVRAGDTAKFMDLVKSRRGTLSQVAAKHLNLDRIMKVTLKCITMTPNLQKCTAESVFRSMLQAVELGLEPGSALGEAYFVPYGENCTLIPGYRGLITLARRSGEVATVQAFLVYEGDEFSVELGSTRPAITHRPKLESEREDKNITWVYAVAVMRDGTTVFDFMTKKQVDGIRLRSKAGSSGPWVTDYAEMARKTIIRRLCKQLPMSVEMAKAVALSDAVDTGDWSHVTFDAEDAEPIIQAEATRGNEAVMAKLNGAAEEPTPAADDETPQEEKDMLLSCIRGAFPGKSDTLLAAKVASLAKTEVRKLDAYAIEELRAALEAHKAAEEQASK